MPNDVQSYNKYLIFANIMKEKSRYGNFFFEKRARTCINKKKVVSLHAILDYYGFF